MNASVPTYRCASSRLLSLIALCVVVSGIVVALVVGTGPSTCFEPALAACYRTTNRNCLPGPCEIAHQHAHQLGLIVLVASALVAAALRWIAQRLKRQLAPR